MKALVITEKCSPHGSQKDGGARVVDTLRYALKEQLFIMQFGAEEKGEADYHYDYPYTPSNRFERRIKNARFIGEKLKDVSMHYSHLIFIHLSMQFGIIFYPPKKGIKVWTFPMFLTPSYQASGEDIPAGYFEMEKKALQYSDNVLTPSHYEKKQLVLQYHIPENKISMIPRGVDTKHLRPKDRKHTSTLQFCSVGSIKLQKNTLGLLTLFKALKERYRSSQLLLIGPVQNDAYGKKVEETITSLGLQNDVELLGHVPPRQLATSIENCHIHLSTARCETFGRSIFETLASGIPNVALKKDNASLDFLSHLPYIHYAQNIEDAAKKVEDLLRNYPMLSKMAQEIGILYDDQVLSKLLSAKICGKKPLIISDYDGTLFHKEDPDKTARSIATFQQYSTKVICTARHPMDLLKEISTLGLRVDWIIGASGAIITDGKGAVLWTTPLTEEDLSLVPIMANPCAFHENAILQVSASKDILLEIPGLRREVYKEKAFVNNWNASKLHAIHHLLKWIQWEGQVHVFGDGPYDQEMITYFDGSFIKNDPKTISEKKELSYASHVL